MSTGPCDFHFEDAIAGFFEFPTENARRILPVGIEPLERCHGQAVLAALAFDFRGGHVGPYREVVLAVLVAPYLRHGSPIPHSAMYPFKIGTSTLRAREHGSAHYYLPHHERDIKVSFDHGPALMMAAGSDQTPIIELSVTRSDGASSSLVERHYQVVSTSESGTYVSDVVMSGENSEHEEETGAIVLHPHTFTDPLDLDGISPWPFREQWMTQGTERFWPVKLMKGAHGRGA